MTSDEQVRQMVAEFRRMTAGMDPAQVRALVEAENERRRVAGMPFVPKERDGAN